MYSILTAKFVHDNEQKVLFLAKLFVVGTCTYNLYVQGTYSYVPVYKLSIFFICSIRYLGGQSETRRVEANRRLKIDILVIFYEE